MKKARISGSRITQKSALFIPAVLLLIFCILPLLAAKEETIIRVGLIYGIGRPQALTLLCDGQFEIVTETGSPITVKAGKKATFTAKGKQIEITIENEEAKCSSGAIKLMPKKTKSKFSVVSPKTRSAIYKYTLEITADSKLKIINELPIEEYVRGVIPAEVPKSFHLEAQKALTVAIRTYALRSMHRHKSEGFNVCDGTNCQVFTGASKEAPWVDALAEATRGQVAAYDNNLIFTTYSSDCGGATQSSEDYGIGKIPYLQTVIDSPSTRKPKKSEPKKDKTNKLDPNIILFLTKPGSTASDPPVEYCAVNPSHIWSRTFTTTELDAVFKKRKDTKVGKFKSMKFSGYDTSGRVRTVIIKGDKGKCRITGRLLRSILGPARIRSTKMTLSTTVNGSYIMNGKGFGHGMGLCSFGANGLAKSDSSVTYIDILKFYYKGIEVKDFSDIKTAVGGQ